MEVSKQARAIIDDMRRKGHLPALDQNVHDICNLTSRSETSGAELTAVIMRDCSLTSNLLATANSILYRPVSPVKTVSTAVSLLGFEKVKSIATGLSIFKNSVRDVKDARLSKLYASSYFAGTFAMALSREKQYGNPEEMFIAGLLYRLPLMAIANAYPDKYQEIEALTRDGKCTYNQACSKILKVEYDELCRGLAEEYHLQGKAGEALHGQDSMDPFVRLVREAEQISDMLFSERKGGREAIEKANGRIAKVLNKGPFSLPDFIVSSCQTDQNVQRFFNLEKDDVEMMVKVLEWGKGTPVEVTAKMAFGETLSADAVKGEDPETLIGHFFTELMMCQRKEGNVNQIIMLAQEALFRCIPSSEVFMAFLDARRDLLIGRFYAGKNPAVQASDFRFNIVQEKSPLIKCLASKASGTLDPAAQAQALPLVAQRLNLKQAMYAPIIAMGKAIGLYFIGRIDINQPFNEKEQAWFDQIVELVGNSFGKLKMSS